MNEKDIKNLCKCGCGREPKLGNIFLHGHGGHSLEAREKQSIAHKKRYEKLEEREKTSLALRIACSTEEARKKKSETAKKIFSMPEMRARMSRISKIVQNRPEIKRRMCTIQKIAQNRPEVRLKHSQTAKIVNNYLDKRLIHSQFMKMRMKDEEYREIFLTTCRKPETKEKQSIIAKEKWKNPDYVRKQMESRRVKQNNKEKELELILHSLYPNEYKFVGDGKVIIDGKCPDFINVNGQKKIIELFGDYWHKGENPKDREDIFKKFGYQTLVIWEHELEEIPYVKLKIHTFMKRI